MPKIVHHDQRREEIAAAVLRVIARDGIKGVTIRETALEAGWSTGVINHYFENKQQLLIGGLRLAATSLAKRMNAAMEKKSGKERLRAIIESGMPLDEHTAAYCRIFFYFWAEGITEEILSAELAANYNWWRGRVHEAIVAEQKRGVIGKIDPALFAELSVAIADGIAIQAMFGAEIDPARQRKQVSTWLKLLYST